MRKLTRYAALVLGLVLLLGAFSGCAGSKDDEGPYTYAYFTASVPASLDPGVPQYDADTVKYIGLLYEGLFTVDSSGKLKKALCKNYYTKEIDGEKRLYIELNDTHWSDGVSVTASNIVYAWKRLLEPSYEGPAAAMLLCLKNAVAVKEGVQKMMTVDDVGLIELNETLLEIRFEDPDYDVDLFLETLASPYLVPVREELVNSNPTGWATVAVEDPTTIATNGPYCITAWTSSGMTLKRNSYYYLKGISNENKQKYVNPERIFIKFGDPVKAEELFDATKDKTAETDFMFYLGNFSGESSYKTKKQDMLSEIAIYFNTNSGSLGKRAFRQGLSAAIDRDAIADAVGGKAATGIVPYGVFETNKASKSFRKTGGNIVDWYDDTSALKSSTLTLTILQGDEKQETASALIRDMWKEYGITLKIRALDYSKYKTVIEAGLYDAIMVDLIAYTTDAFSVLGQFSMKYSGKALTQNENYEYGFVAHTTGFDGETFNSLMDEAYAETNLKKRAKLLHEAEEELIDAMIVVPVTFNVDEYATTQMNGLGSSWYSFRIFNKVKVSNYEKYIAAEEAKQDEQLANSTKGQK